MAIKLDVRLMIEYLGNFYYKCLIDLGFPNNGLDWCKHVFLFLDFL